MKKQNEKQRTVTKNQLLMIEGLLAMRNEVKKQFEWIEKTIAEIVQEPEDDYGDYYGHVSDYMWEDTGAKKLLKDLDIKVVEEKKVKKSKKKSSVVEPIKIRFDVGKKSKRKLKNIK